MAEQAAIDAAAESIRQLRDNTTCEQIHTPCPDDYVSWHDWAQAKTEAGWEQERCDVCGRWAVWMPPPQTDAVADLIESETP